MLQVMDDVPVKVSLGSTRLIDRLRIFIRSRNLAWATEKAYLHWVKRFIYFHQKRHPETMGAAEIEQFLSHLAITEHAAAGTQGIALNALIFFYREFLQQPPGLLNFELSRKHRRIPVVFEHTEAMAVIDKLAGSYWLIGMLLYGGGLRVMECLRLRIKDIDITMKMIIVRDGKGGKDRRTLLPTKLIEPIKQQIERVAHLHEQDVRDGYGEVWMPNALARKYPKAATELGWQFLFPSANIGADPQNGGCVAIIFIRALFKELLVNRLGLTGSSSKLPAIRFDTVLQRGCWRVVTIFVPFRNCWVTAMLPQRKSIPMF